MKGYGKRSMGPQDEVYPIVQVRGCDFDRPAIEYGSMARRRGNANWAWAGGVADYDWMDHAPLFDQYD